MKEKISLEIEQSLAGLPEMDKIPLKQSLEEIYTSEKFVTYSNIDFSDTNGRWIPRAGRVVRFENGVLVGLSFGTGDQDARTKMGELLKIFKTDNQLPQEVEDLILAAVTNEGLKTLAGLLLVSRESGSKEEGIVIIVPKAVRELLGDHLEADYNAKILAEYYLQEGKIAN